MDGWTEGLSMENPWALELYPAGRGERLDGWTNYVASLTLNYIYKMEIMMVTVL